VYAYENAPFELLTKLDGVESHGFKAVGDAKKELVAQIEREFWELEQKVIQALGVGEEEVKVEEEGEEMMGEEQVEKAVVEDVHIGDQPLLDLRKCQRGTRVGRRAHGVLLTLSTSTSSNFQQLPTTGQTTEPASAPDSIDTPHLSSCMSQ